MTEQEKKELIAEIVAVLDDKYAEKSKRDAVGSVLETPRNKWFSASKTKTAQAYNNSLMSQAFKDDGVRAWDVWEAIRKLTCCVCGKTYVRHLSEVENAEEICEKICQFVYDLRTEVKNG